MKGSFSMRVLRLVAVFLASSLALTGAGFAQQVVERGAFGKPGQVLDDTGQWTTPLLMASDSDVQLYIPDVTSPDWLKKNYRNYIDRGTYVLIMFTFYKTPAACQANQTAWGLGDKQHLDACLTTGYRIRKALIEPHSESVTLLQAAMVDQNGNIDKDSIQTPHTYRVWSQLDPNTETAIRKANDLIHKQMKIYDAKMQNAQ